MDGIIHAAAIKQYGGTKPAKHAKPTARTVTPQPTPQYISRTIAKHVLVPNKQDDTGIDVAKSGSDWSKASRVKTQGQTCAKGGGFNI